MVSSNFQGKVAVVTASTDGIGFAIAKKLATDGAQVVISSRKVNVKLTVRFFTQTFYTYMLPISSAQPLPPCPVLNRTFFYGGRFKYLPKVNSI